MPLVRCSDLVRLRRSSTIGLGIFSHTNLNVQRISVSSATLLLGTTGTPKLSPSIRQYLIEIGTRISNERQANRPARPFVEWLAGSITSPVQRLRFLRGVMSLPKKQHRRSYRSWLLLSWLVVLLVIEVQRPSPWTRPSEGIGLWRNAEDRHGTAAVRVAPQPEIWLVDKTDAFETYSNGLRIENRFSVANRTRSYLVFSASRPNDIVGERRFVPAGIVFHTTESPQAPFESRHNSSLKRIAQSLLAAVRLKRSYNFLIDRFGRVYRVVREADAANHAGNSVWADPHWLYLSLNQSFLGISFETETLPGQLEATVKPAQVQAAALLTGMLRQRYSIPAGNCVTHAQVSVNISNFLVGYHTDWASSFPFQQLGLPDNYAIPLPAVSVFGFECDSVFLRQGGVRLSKGVMLAEQVLGARAAAAHASLAAYRNGLQTKYWSQLSAVRSDATGMDLQE